MSGGGDGGERRIGTTATAVSIRWRVNNNYGEISYLYPIHDDTRNSLVLSLLSAFHSIIIIQTS